MKSWLRWVLLGLLGLLVAAAVAFLAIRTVSEKIGISSESPAAGRALAPGNAAPARKKPLADSGDASTAPVTTTIQPQPAPAHHKTGDDHANGGDGKGGDD